MLIEIPDLTPEMCEARAEYLRMLDWTPEAQRARADAAADSWAAAAYLLNAALMEQYPARPVLKVGDLATWRGDRVRGDRVRVDYIGKRRVVITTRRGTEWTESARALTPLGEPAPDDWGQG